MDAPEKINANDSTPNNTCLSTEGVRILDSMEETVSCRSNENDYSLAAHQKPGYALRSYVEKFINTKIGPVPVIKTRLGRDDLFATFYVWCAAGKGTFSTQELVKRIIESHLDRIVRHKRVIVPRLGATGVSAFDVKKQSRFRFIYGPVRASGIRAFLKNGKKSEKQGQHRLLPPQGLKRR